METKENSILIKGGTLYLENEVLKQAYVKIDGSVIGETGLIKQNKSEIGYQVIELPNGYKVVPGFIDLHIHGADNADTMDATEEALDKISAVLPQEGTTSFLATTITSTINHTDDALKNVADYMSSLQKSGHAEVLGVHLEGPFINPERAGAQPKSHIMLPDMDLLMKWLKLADGQIKQVTLAPEQENAVAMIRLLHSKAIIASIGHSDATYEEVREAMDAGATSVTHLFNQMKGLHHREPGTAGAALLHDELKAEIIVDGIHVRPEMIKLAFKQKGSEGLLLITDSMRAKWLCDGEYDLGGQQVHVKGDKAVLEDGTLAGSVLKMGHGVKNVMEYTGCSLADAITMASENPAKQLTIFDRKGSLKTGKDADIVILDRNSQVVMTFCRGKLAFDKKGGTYENYNGERL